MEIRNHMYELRNASSHEWLKKIIVYVEWPPRVENSAVVGSTERDSCFASVWTAVLRETGAFVTFTALICGEVAGWAVTCNSSLWRLQKSIILPVQAIWAQPSSLFVLIANSFSNLFCIHCNIHEQDIEWSGTCNKSVLGLSYKTDTDSNTSEGAANDIRFLIYYILQNSTKSSGEQFNTWEGERLGLGSAWVAFRFSESAAALRALNHPGGGAPGLLPLSWSFLFRSFASNCANNTCSLEPGLRASIKYRGTSIVARCDDGFCTFRFRINIWSL